MPAGETDDLTEPTDTAEVRRALQTANKLYQREELSEAAAWLRRAAKMLMEDGVEDRAVDIARLAAELDEEGRNSAPPPARNDEVSHLRGRSRVFREPTGRHKAVQEHAPAPVRNDRARPAAATRTGNTGKHKAAKEVFASAPLAVAPRPTSPARGALPTAGLAAKSAFTPAAASSASSSRQARERDEDTSPSIVTGVPVLRGPTPSPAALRGAPIPLAVGKQQAPRPSAVAHSTLAKGKAGDQDYIASRLPSLLFFDEFSTERLREISRQIQVLRLKDGDLLFEAGAPPGPMFVVTAGGVQVETLNESPFRVTMKEDTVIGVVSALYQERTHPRSSPRQSRSVRDGAVAGTGAGPRERDAAGVSRKRRSSARRGTVASRVVDAAPSRARCPGAIR